MPAIQPYRPQPPADPLHGNPCDPRGPRRYSAVPSTAPCSVQPLKGLQEYRAHVLSNRALAPGGAGDDGARTTVHCSLITVHWSYTFSAKERDAETGLSYFGSRYYSSDLSIWLSVDPMAAKYASLSPYTYCTNNPVKLVDPNGEEVWIPGVDEKGNVTYTAEAGDNLGTFASQFDCRDVNGRYLDADGQYISERIFKNAKLSTTEDIKEGTVIKGEHVKKATNGSDVLKGNWWKMNDSQKASQIMFALMYGANKKHTLPNGLFGIDLNDFINGFYSKDGGSKYYNVTIPLKGGDKIVVDMWLAPFTAFEGEKGSLWVGTSPEWGDYNDARSADPARFRTAKNANADRPMKVITVSVPANRRNDFNNSLKR